MTRPFLGTVLFLAACVALPAQWLRYPTPNIPRTADGKPDLSAPTPRTREGKPDFSGIWGEPRYPRNQGVRAPFINIGGWVKGGLPYTPEGKKLVDERSPVDSKARATEPSVLCLPTGLVYRYYHSLRKIVQLPDLFLILNERNASFRQVLMDGRPLPEDPVPTYDGYSVGTWDGDTLVIESAGFNSGIWLDEAGNPLSEQARITERLRRQDFGHMTAEIKINDPVMYTKPWTATLPLILNADTELLVEICAEGEKDAIRMQRIRDAQSSAK